MEKRGPEQQTGKTTEKTTEKTTGDSTGQGKMTIADVTVVLDIFNFGKGKNWS